MEEYNNEILGIKDLFCELVKRWKFILMCALFTGVLFGCFRVVNRLAYRNSSEFKTQSELYFANDNQYYLEKRKNLENDLISLEKRESILNEYCSNSILMKINPYDKKSSSAEIIISVPENNISKLDYIKKIYIDFINNGSAIKNLENKLFVEPQYLQELINVTTLDDKEGYNRELDRVFNDTASVHIEAIGIEDKNTEELLAVLLDEIQKTLYPKLKSNIGDHDLYIIPLGTVTLWDDGLFNYQKEKHLLRTTLANELYDQTKELENLQEPVVMSIPNRIVFLSGSKYMLLGLFIGGVCGLIFMIMNCFYSEKVLDMNVIKKATNIDLCFIFSTRKKRTIEEKINYLANKIQYQKNVCSDDVICEIIAQTIKKDKTITNIQITGSVTKDNMDQFYVKISSFLPDMKIHMVSDLTIDLESANALEYADAVIFLGEIGVSTNAGIINSLTLLNKFKISTCWCLIYY